MRKLMLILLAVLAGGLLGVVVWNSIPAMQRYIKMEKM